MIKQGAKKKASKKRISLRGSIDEFCRECIYDPKQRELGTWRQQIHACTSNACPLFAVRPQAYTPKGESK